MLNKTALMIALAMILSVSAVSAHWWCYSGNPIDYVTRPVVVNQSAVLNSSTGNVSLMINSEVCKHAYLPAITWTFYSFENKSQTCDYPFPDGSCGKGGYGERKCLIWTWANKFPSGPYIAPGTGGVVVSTKNSTLCKETGVMFVVKRTMDVPLAQYNSLEGFSTGTGYNYGDSLYTYPSQYIALNPVQTINCTKDSDCKSEMCDVNSSSFCQPSDLKKVFKNFKVPKCENNGTVDSYCKIETIPRAVGNCTFKCDSGKCI